MSDEQRARHNWQSVFQTPQLREAFETDMDNVTLLWSPLREAADAQTDAKVRAALETLSAIASLYVLPDDWNAGYGPLYQSGEGRTFLPSDLTLETLALLKAVVDHVPHDLLRARVHDIIAMRVNGSERIHHVRAHLRAIVADSIDSERWFGEREMWHRAIDTARRFGKSTKQELADLESQLLRGVLEGAPDNYFQAQVSDMLMKRGLGRASSIELASHLRAMGDSFTEDPDKARTYHQAAGDWFGIGGDNEARSACYTTVITSYIAEAETLTEKEAGNLARAGYLFELALRELQSLPRTDREKFGMSNTAAILARRIREVGAAGLGDMRRFESDPIDLSEAAQEAKDRVSGLGPHEALLVFTMLNQFASFERDRAEAEKRTQAHPLSALFSITTYSADGRIVKRSDGSGGAPVFGIDPAVWRQMVQAHVLRIQLLVAGRLWPAFESLTNEHHLSIADFDFVAANSSTVPLDHARQFARGLYYGYIGDFSTAAQLLTLQIEHFVRHHLTNAGVLTTTRTAEGIENEKGISSLLEMDQVQEIFGDDLTYELRVLYFDATGPNLRNEIAHGLLTDSTAEGATSLYTWWLALRIVYLQFWNQRHDAEAKAASEPAEPDIETGA